MKSERKTANKPSRSILYLIFVTVITSLVLLTGCAGDTGNGNDGGDGVSGDPDQGAMLIVDYGCGSCHVIPGIEAAEGTIGPSLEGYPAEAQIAGVLENTPENTVQWIMNPTEIKPDTTMPDQGVAEGEAQDITAYLYTLE